MSLLKQTFQSRSIPDPMPVRTIVRSDPEKTQTREDLGFLPRRQLPPLTATHSISH